MNEQSNRISPGAHWDLSFSNLSLATLTLISSYENLVFKSLLPFQAKQIATLLGPAAGVSNLCSTTGGFLKTTVY